MSGRENEVAAKQREVTYLQKNLDMERTKLSVTINDIVEYCNRKAPDDPLLNPKADNPFKKKSKCTIL